jgi:hypothetical protein
VWIAAKSDKPPKQSVNSLSSIQVPVDIYGHLIPGANVRFVDQLDGVPVDEGKTSPPQSALPRNTAKWRSHRLLQVVEEIGGGGRTRTYDLRIMRPSL